MKKLISVFCALALLGTAAFAQKNQDGDQWREKVRAEQVAMITSELNLTESEAQTFWPVYNDVQQQRREAFRAQADAFKALKDGADSKDAAQLLDAYFDAKKKCEALDTEALARYKKVLPIEKVAKLIVAEEKFRRQQIGKLGGRKGHPGAPEGRRSGQRGHVAPPMGEMEE